MKKRMIVYGGLIVGAYLLLVAVMYVMQDALVFPGAWMKAQRVALLPGVRVETIEVEDRVSGEPTRVRLAVAGDGDSAVGVVPVENSREQGATPTAVVVSFLGNAEDLASAVYWASEWHNGYGLGAVVLEYPGYGESTGKPSKRSFLAAGEAALAYARKAFPGAPVFLFGNSIGTFVAVHLAAATPGEFEGMLLRAPPGNMPAAAQANYPLLPARLLLRHRFDAISEAASVTTPTLILHGDRDSIAPLRLARKLAATLGGPSRLRLCPGYGHNDLPLYAEAQYGDEIRAFFADPAAAVADGR